MTKEMQELERRIDSLRAEVRRAMTGGDRARATALRAELRQAQRQWDDSLDEIEAELPPEAELAPEAGAEQGPRVSRSAGARSPLLPAREQVHQALTLLGVPAAQRLIVTVHDAFFAGELAGARLTSLRRDEERSFRSAPYARPYYLCAALTADLLAPARGLLAVSTWAMDRRVVGPLSPRVDFLSAAIRIAERIQELNNDNSGANADSRRLLWRFAANIPRAASGIATMDPREIISAAKAELSIHEQADSDQRAASANRARVQLDDAEQLFGTGLQLIRQPAIDG